MAVVDLYTNSNAAAGKLVNPALFSGADTKALVAVAELAASDSNGSVYRLARLGANIIPLDIQLNNDVLTSGTDFDLGIYKIGVDGLVKDKDIFVDGADLSSGHAQGSELEGMSAIGIADLGKKMYELAGDDIGDKQTSYDICLTANVAGTSGGTVVVKMLLAQG